MTTEYHGAYRLVLPDYATGLYALVSEDGRVAVLHEADEYNYVVESYWEDVGVSEWWTVKGKEEAENLMTHLCGPDAEYMDYVGD